MDNYQIILFKNKKKKKIIKGYSLEKYAQKKFDSLLDKSNKILFEVKYENFEECNYELGLLCLNEISNVENVYRTDELGRYEKVHIEDDTNYKIIKIQNYKIEEKMFDWQTNKRITVNQFIKTYLPKKNMKVVSTLNNKIVVQEDEIFSLFSLKNLEDSERFLISLESLFLNSGRRDCIFVRDYSITQRKWLYDILEKKGFDKNRLYRQLTTFAKRK